MAEQLELFDDEAPDDRPDRGPAEPNSNERERAGEASPGIASDDGDAPPRTVIVRVGLDEALTERAAALARDLQLDSLADAVHVVWYRRLRTTAGRAHGAESCIDLNPKLQTLPEPERDEEIERTFLHELAHLVAYHRAGHRIQPHGPEWQRACADLGIPGEDRCHDIGFQPRRMRRKYTYRCPSCGYEITRVRRPKRPVACRRCCRAYAGGRYDERFRLRERRLG